MTRSPNRLHALPAGAKRGSALHSIMAAIRLAAREKRMAIELTVLLIVEAASAGAAIIFIKEYLERLIRGGDTRGVWVGAVILLSIWVVRTAASLGAKIWRYNLARAIELHARVDVLSHLMRLSVGFLENHSRADLIQRVNSDTAALRDSLIALATAAGAAARVLSLIAVAFMMDAVLATVGLIAMPVAIPLLLWVGRHVERDSGRQRHASVKLVDLLVELLNGIRTIKAYNGDERERKFHEESCREIYYFTGRAQGWQAAAAAIPELALGVGLVFIVLVGGLRLSSGALEWPALLAFMVAMLGMQGPFTAMIQAQSQVRARQPFADRYFQLLGVEPQVKDPAHPVPVSEGAPRIEFRNVAFDTGDGPIVEGLSFTIQPGETIGIVGPTGAGKTTLLNLVARFVDATDGAVIFNGTDIREFRHSDYLRRIALVTQDPFLFATDVAANLSYGRPDATEAEIRAAAAAAGVLDEIEALPEGFATRVGLGGRPLSGGQAQRISLARALIKDAPLLLLDEATSALDSETESRAQAAIDNYLAAAPRTTLIVAHRLSTLRRAHRILVLDQGRVAGFAPHEELLRTCDVYRRLVEHQTMLGAADMATPAPILVAP